MGETNWECNVCEACGVCTGSQKECDTYHEFYGMGETQAGSEGGKTAVRPETNWECNTCEACGICTGSQKECDTYHEFYGMEGTPDVIVQFADGPAIISSAATDHKIMNKGIINRLPGRIINVIEGEVMAQMTIDIGLDNYVSTIMPIEKYLESGKTIGDLVTIAFKAFNVVVMR